jgi:hypothetical protein
MQLSKPPKPMATRKRLKKECVMNLRNVKFSTSHHYPDNTDCWDNIFSIGLGNLAHWKAGSSCGGKLDYGAGWPWAGGCCEGRSTEDGPGASDATFSTLTPTVGLRAWERGGKSWSLVSLVVFALLGYEHGSKYENHNDWYKKQFYTT